MIHSIRLTSLFSLALGTLVWTQSGAVPSQEPLWSIVPDSIQIVQPVGGASFEIYLSADQMPRFEGQGLREFRTWVMTRIQYPEEAFRQKITGKVIASFVIEQDGTLTSIEILHTPSPLLSDEVQRVLLTSPIWNPGKMANEQLVRVRMIIPIDFVIAQPEETQPADEDDQPFLKVDRMPRFQNSDLNAFREWMQAQIQYTPQMLELKLSGMVTFMFIVERDGRVSNFEAVSSPHPLLSEQAERILYTSPVWTPGTQRGVPVRVRYVLPLKFNFPQADITISADTVSTNSTVINQQQNKKIGNDLHIIQSKLHYPDLAIEYGISGKVTVSFIVETDGRISNITILQSPDRSFSDEVIRVLNETTHLTPGVLNGKPTRIRYIVPFLFKMSPEGPYSNQNYTPKPAALLRPKR